MSEATQERAAFAEWLARQHLEFDSRLAEVIYLPTGAPEDEVRLLEVNTGLYRNADQAIVAVETTPAIADLPFRVWIADVTSEEWERIQSSPDKLPIGWSLEAKRITRRRAR